MNQVKDTALASVEELQNLAGGADIKVLLLLLLFDRGHFCSQESNLESPTFLLQSIVTWVRPQCRKAKRNHQIDQAEKKKWIESIQAKFFKFLFFYFFIFYFLFIGLIWWKFEIISWFELNQAIISYLFFSAFPLRLSSFLSFSFLLFSQQQYVFLVMSIHLKYFLVLHDFLDCIKQLFSHLVWKNALFFVAFVPKKLWVKFWCKSNEANQTDAKSDQFGSMLKSTSLVWFSSWLRINLNRTMPIPTSMALLIKWLDSPEHYLFSFLFFIIIIPVQHQAGSSCYR